MMFNTKIQVQQKQLLNCPDKQGEYFNIMKYSSKAT